MRDLGDGAPNVAGYDTPEVRNARCQIELELGRAATAAMNKLLNGAKVYDSGERDRYGRPLVWVRTADGRSVGSILIAERLAREWRPGYRAQWC